MKEVVLVTGGAGFIGSHLVKYLLGEGKEVIVLDDLSTGKLEKLTNRAEFIEGNVNDIENYLKGRKIDKIYHLAAQARIQKSWDKPEFTYQNNVNGTKAILDFARDNNVKRVMITSSNSVYGQYGFCEKRSFVFTEDLPKMPTSPYAWHKALDEELARMYSICWGIKVVVVRPFNVYGPDQPLHNEYSCVFPKFLDQWKHKKKLTIYGKGSQTRDFTHVDDVVEGMAKVMESQVWNNFTIVNLCRGMETSINQLANMFSKKKQIHIKSPRNKEMLWTLGSNDKLYDLTGFRPSKNVNNFVKEYKK